MLKKGQLFQIQECIDWVKGFRKKKKNLNYSLQNKALNLKKEE